MPRVKEYQPNRVETQVVPGAKARELPLGAFSGGAAIAAGASDLIKGVGEMKDRIDLTTAEETLVKFERDKNDLFFNPDSGYFNTQGKAAYDTAPDANESLQKLVKTYSESVPAGKAREAFMKVANRHVTSGQKDIMTHANKGIQAWETATSQAVVENTIESASLYWNDPERMAVQRALGRQELLATMDREGITGDARNERLQTYDSSFASAAIDAATVQGGAKGREALSKYGDMLEGPERMKVERKIQKQEKADREQAVAQESVIKASNLVNRYGDDKEARGMILDEIAKIKDPEVQQKARKEAMYQLNQREEARAEARVAAFEMAEDFVLSSGSAEQFKAAYPNEWEKLSPKQKSSIEKGTPVDNDWNLWYELSLSDESKLRSMSPDKVASYASRLDRSHRDRFISLVREAKGLDGSNSRDKADAQIGRTRAAQTQSAVEQVLGKKRGKWSTSDMSKVDNLYGMFDAEYRRRKDSLGRELDPDEFTDLLNGFTRKVTIERNWLPDPELGIDDIPEEHLGSLTQYLRQNNLPVTADNLVKAYEQAK